MTLKTNKVLPLERTMQIDKIEIKNVYSFDRTTYCNILVQVYSLVNHIDVLDHVSVKVVC